MSEITHTTNNNTKFNKWLYPCLVVEINVYKGLSRVTTYNHTTKVKMKNEYLKNHLATIDLSFLKVVKDEIIEEKNRNELKVVKAMFEETNCFYNAKKEIADWSKDIEVLEDYFKAITTDKQPIQLNKCTVINDVSLFIDSHLATVKANNGNKTFLPYLNRLQELKQVLKLKVS